MFTMSTVPLALAKKKEAFSTVWTVPSTVEVHSARSVPKGKVTLMIPSDGIVMFGTPQVSVT